MVGHWVLAARKRVSIARSCENQFWLNINPVALALGLCCSRHTFVADWLGVCEAITRALGCLAKAAKVSLHSIKVRNPKWIATGLQACGLSHILLHVHYLHSNMFVQGKSSLNTMLILFLLLLELPTVCTDSNNISKPVQRLTFNVSVGFCWIYTVIIQGHLEVSFLENYMKAGWQVP